MNEVVPSTYSWLLKKERQSKGAQYYESRSISDFCIIDR